MAKKTLKLLAKNIPQLLKPALFTPASMMVVAVAIPPSLVPKVARPFAKNNCAMVKNSAPMVRMKWTVAPMVNMTMATMEILNMNLVLSLSVCVFFFLCCSCVCFSLEHVPHVDKFQVSLLCLHYCVFVPKKNISSRDCSLFSIFYRLKVTSIWGLHKQIQFKYILV